RRARGAPAERPPRQLGLEPGPGAPAAPPRPRRAPGPLRRVAPGRRALRTHGENAMTVTLTRRDWLKASAIAGGGLVLAAHPHGLGAPAGSGEPVELNAWLRIGGGGAGTIVLAHA